MMENFGNNSFIASVLEMPGVTSQLRTVKVYQPKINVQLLVFVSGLKWFSDSYQFVRNL